MKARTEAQERAMVKLAALATAAGRSPDPDDVDWWEVVQLSYWHVFGEEHPHSIPMGPMESEKYMGPGTLRGFLGELALELEREVAGVPLLRYVETLGRVSI